MVFLLRWRSASNQLDLLTVKIELELNPGIGPVRRLTNQWFYLMMLLRYWHIRCWTVASSRPM